MQATDMREQSAVPIEEEESWEELGEATDSDSDPFGILLAYGGEDC